MTASVPKIRPLGDTGTLLQWEETPSEQLLHYMIAVKKHLSEQLQCEVVHTYTELLLKKPSPTVTASEIKKLLETVEVETTVRRKLFTIPVCYGRGYGEDLEALALMKQLSVKEFIAMHTAPEYLIYFIGFLPGFLYLDGLHERLVTPRKATPRLKVTSGSVAIGGNHTGIYPQESPGGWHIIGRTPIDLFDVRRQEPSPFKAGDKIRFEAISITTFQKIKRQVENGIYNYNVKVF
ncbi:5-oxoprolinase subunit PxpB [Dokdonia sinensis]|nr:5-oxoprolinase subunit PxpB [Dokdonia sinensis]